ncbi:phage tailspike protein [Acerihabitans sp.]|uniref:phage tailspike protein n=1 Tax=Acerihabitans sp. TaxID=2811394 RepID=UPI002ED99AC1
MTMPNVIVSMPSQLFTLANSFAACGNGSIYVGQIDTDPTVPANQIQVYVENADGTYTAVSQPIAINAGGYPVYADQVAKFATVEGQSMTILDANGALQFYFPNLLRYDPDQTGKRLGVTSVVALRLVNGEPGSIAILNGYYEGGNVGGGILMWINDTTRQDDSGIFFRVNSVGGWVRAIEDEIHAEWFGVTGDGADHSSNVNAAIDYIKYAGGILSFPKGEVNFGLLRKTISWDANLKPFTLRGYGTKITADNINPPERGTANWSSEGYFLAFMGASSTNYFPQVIIEGIDFDYSRQKNKGGTDLATIGVCHPTPYSKGITWIYFIYAMRPTIRNGTFSNIYGNGIYVRQSYCPLTENLQFNTVSANQILSRTGDMSLDSDGGCIFYWGCFGGVISNNAANNLRVYEVHVLSTDNSTDMYGMPCGYIGMWAEYRMTIGSTPPPFIDWMTSSDDINLVDQTQRNVSIQNCTVRGYVMGFKVESTSDAVITNCVAVECYIPFCLSGVRGTIRDCYGNMLRLGAVLAPQGGLEAVRSIFTISDFTGMVVGERDYNVGNTIQNCQGISQRSPFFGNSRSGLRVTDCLFIRKTGANYQGLWYSRNSVTTNMVLSGNTFIIDADAGIGESTIGQIIGFTFENNTITNKSNTQLLIRSTSALGGQHKFLNNKFYGGVKIQNSVCISQSIGNYWFLSSNNNTNGILGIGYENFISENDTFELYSAASAYPVTINGGNSVVRNARFIITDNGVKSVPALITTSNVLNQKYFDNRWYGNTQNSALVRVSGASSMSFDSNRTDSASGALIYVTGGLSGPIFHDKNIVGNLFAGSVPATDPNSLANAVGWAITPYPGLRVFYTMPSSGNREGIIYTSDLGWREFGSII